MPDFTQDASLASKQAQDSELIALRQQMDRLKGDLTPGQNAQQKLRKACTDFEAVFLSKMWEQMRSTIPKGDPLHSPQEDMYRSMFDRDFSEKLAGDGGIGLGDMLYKQLKDKIKNTTKVTGKTGLDTLAAAKSIADTAAADAAAGSSAAKSQTGSITTTTHGAPASSGALERTVYKTPSRPMGSGGALPGVQSGVQSGTVGSSAGTIGKSADSTAVITSRRAMESLSSTAASSAPTRPASVPGDVMADVEALAQRIEADYDHRLLVNGIKPEQQSGTQAEVSTSVATSTGYEAANYGTSGYGATGYGASQVRSYGQSGRGSGTGNGRKLATIG